MWSNAFYAYPGAVELCWGHASHSSSRTFEHAYGTNDSRRKVIKFYDNKHAAHGKGGTYHTSDADSRSVLHVYTRAAAIKRKVCRSGKFNTKTVIFISSEVSEPGRGPFDPSF